MIVVKNDGTQIIQVSIVIFKSTKAEIWVNNSEMPIVVSVSDISTIS